MKTLKNIITAIPGFKSSSSKTKKRETKEVITTKFGGKLRQTSNTILSQMYSEENETLFI